MSFAEGRDGRRLLREHPGNRAFERNLAAILADLTALSLRSGVDGMVGLTFLRQFQSWGAERGAQGRWQFFLVSEDENE